MPALARKAQRARFVAGEFHAEPYKIVNDLGRRADHLFDRPLVVFEMSRTHGILEVGVEILFAAQHTNAALREIRIAFVQRALAQNERLCSGGKIEGAEQPRNARARDDGAVFFFDIHFRSAISNMALRGLNAFSATDAASVTSPQPLSRQESTLSRVIVFISGQHMPPSVV